MKMLNNILVLTMLLLVKSSFANDAHVVVGIGKASTSTGCWSDPGDMRGTAKQEAREDARAKCGSDVEIIEEFKLEYGFRIRPGGICDSETVAIAKFKCIKEKK